MKSAPTAFVIATALILAGCAQHQLADRVALMSSEMRTMEAACPPPEDTVGRGMCINGVLRYAATSLWPKGYLAAEQAIRAHAEAFSAYAAGQATEDETVEQANAVARQFTGMLRAQIDSESIRAQHLDHLMTSIVAAGVLAAHSAHRIETPKLDVKGRDRDVPVKPDRVVPAKPTKGEPPPKVTPAEPAIRVGTDGSR